MVSQLSLFDTATVIKPAYKVGDRVKLRKKPSAASYVKKGDIVEVVAVHPINGSIKFWNERSERWEFVEADEIASVVTDDSPTPDEIASVVTDDSPTPAEIAVGESIAPDDSPTPAEIAVGESIAPDDSPTPAEIAVGESIAPDDSPTPAEIAVGESIAPSGDTDYVLDPISIYKPRGTARGGKYYRLSYKDGGKVRQVHIRGGNIDSPIAQAKVQEVRSLLAAGVTPAEIAAMLRIRNPELSAAP